MGEYGEVAEWSKAHAWKVCVSAMAPWVRIPSSPPCDDASATLKLMKKFIHLGRLELVSFVTGFCLLTYELAAARILAPVIGSSTYVWTSVIGVIIAALAAGFWTGGKLADARNRASDLALLLILAALAALITVLLYPAVLASITTSEVDVRVLALYVALILFAPTSFVIGMTSPYVAKLTVHSLKTTGQKIASIDALNSIGGIVGTFLTGFVLFGSIGSHQTFLVVITLLLIASWCIAPQYRARQRLFLSGLIVIIGGLSLSSGLMRISIDTPSAHYEVVNGAVEGRSVRALLTGPTGAQSAVYTDGSSELVFWYTREIMRLVVLERPESVLVLGGGAFTLPEKIAREYPETRVDSVEIDPVLVDVAKEHFSYTQLSNVTHHYGDARQYVNRTDQRYDMVIVDVYGDTSIPFQLMTAEYGRAITKALTPQGSVVANVITALEGTCEPMTAAIVGSYAPSLPFATYSTQASSPDERANYIMTFSRDERIPQGMKRLSVTDKAIYTDNYTPAEQLHGQCRAYQKQ